MPQQYGRAHGSRFVCSSVHTDQLGSLRLPSPPDWWPRLENRPLSKHQHMSGPRNDFMSTSDNRDRTQVEQTAPMVKRCGGVSSGRRNEGRWRSVSCSCTFLSLYGDRVLTFLYGILTGGMVTMPIRAAFAINPTYLSLEREHSVTDDSFFAVATQLTIST